MEGLHTNAEYEKEVLANFTNTVKILRKDGEPFQDIALETMLHSTYTLISELHRSNQSFVQMLKDDPLEKQTKYSILIPFDKKEDTHEAPIPLGHWIQAGTIYRSEQDNLLTQKNIQADFSGILCELDEYSNGTQTLTARILDTTLLGIPSKVMFMLCNGFINSESKYFLFQPGSIAISIEENVRSLYKQLDPIFRERHTNYGSLHAIEMLKGVHHRISLSILEINE